MPAPEFVSSETAMRVILFGPRAFNEMTKADKMRACFFHCVLRWMTRDYMSNASLRERFSLADKEYQAVSAIIAESIKAAASRRRILRRDGGTRGTFLIGQHDRST